jgi:hypothetical protein
MLLRLDGEIAEGKNGQKHCAKWERTRGVHLLFGWAHAEAALAEATLDRFPAGMPERVCDRPSGRRAWRWIMRAASIFAVGP